MRRFLLYSLAGLLVLVTVAMGVGAWLIQDELFLKRQASKWTHHFTGRELNIDGALELSVGSTIHLDASGVRLANATWAEPADMVSVGQLKVAMDALALLRGELDFSLLELRDCAAYLFRDEEHGGNWENLGPVSETDAAGDETVDSADKSTLKLTLRHNIIENCHFELRSPKPQLDVALERLQLVLGDDARWQTSAAATVNSEPLELEGWYGPAGVLSDGGQLDHELRLILGGVVLDSRGTVKDIHAGTGANIETRFTGPAIEKIIAYLDSPAISEGPFDFRLTLSTEDTGTMTSIMLKGDLGLLKISADGQLNSLLDPSTGEVQLNAKGPSLGNLGAALKKPGLVDEPFELQLQTTFEPGVMQIASSSLTTPGDRLQIDGRLGLSASLAGSDLNITLESTDPGRWGPGFGQPYIDLGAIGLEAALTADMEGQLTTQVHLTQEDSALKLSGSLGKLASTLDHELDIDFNSTNISPLATLAGWPGVPSAPVSLKGHIKRKDKQIEFHQLGLDFAGDSAELDGQLVLEKGMAGSNVSFSSDISDLASLGDLWGKAGLPAEPVRLDGELQVEGKGMRFKLQEHASQALRLDISGHIKDLADPLVMDAEFDIALPDASWLNFLLTDRSLPAVPASLRGELENVQSKTELRGVKASLGQVSASADGNLMPGPSFDLQLSAQAPDARALDFLLGSMPSVPIGVAGSLTGNPKAFEIGALQATLGESNLSGGITVNLHDMPRFEGKLKAEVLDLNHWSEVNQDEPAARPKKDRKFDDTPLPALADLGVSVDLDLRAAKVMLHASQLSNLVIKATMDPRRLVVERFEFKPPRGSLIEGRFLIDESGAVPVLETSLSGTGVRLGLMSEEGQDIDTLPKTDISVVLRTRGNTHHEAASALTGKIRYVGGQGQIANSGVNFLFNDFLTELFNTLNPFAESSEFTTLECAVAAIDIVDGQATLGPIVANTTELTVFSEGTINLDTEQVDLYFNTKPKKGLGINVGVIINPMIKVGGTLAQPLLELDPKGTVISGTAAIATAGLSLLAKSVSDRFLSSKDPCGDAMATIEERDDSP